MLRVVCLLVVALAAQDEQKTLPELKSFLAEFRKTLHSDELLLSQYTFTRKETLIRLDSDQKPKDSKVNVYEVFPGSSERAGYRRRVVKDGVRLTGGELKKEDEDLRRRIQSKERKLREETPAEREKARAEKLREEERILDDMFALYGVRILRREMLGGRTVIVADFTPRPDYKPKTSEGKNGQHVGGRAWISEDDHQLARLELEVFEPISIGFGILAKLQKGAHITVERQKFNDEIWLPVKTEVEMSFRFLMLKGFNFRQIVEYSDHRKYSVDTILKFPDQVTPPGP
ncbi:MAG TPA: hypothetical protein VE422_43960 [Terriglobia bacterium]|nr:hypothetical protein [Terriglobia bacterium]